jgi:hypothetical protein
MSARIKVEAVKSRSEFIEFIRVRNLDFIGMSVSGCRKKNTWWVACSSDERITEIMLKSFDSIDYDYIMYLGKDGGKFYVAAEIKS